VTARARAPGRGDLVWINLDPRAGHEERGRRPAIVLSPNSYNRKVGLAILCPITSAVKSYPFEVAMPDGFGISGVVLADHIKSLDWRARRAEVKEKLPSDVTEEVLAKLNALLT
jgi:mRNA interferase MazF